MRLCIILYACIRKFPLTNFFSARVSLFGLVDDEVEVREGSDPTVRVCVEMLSSGPLLQNAFLRVVGQDGSALGQWVGTRQPHCM